jgi:hypothetical protein
LAIIGKLCLFLEIGKIVMALSRKPVILAVPVQAWQAARMSKVGCKSGWRRSGKVVGNLQSARTSAKACGKVHKSGHDDWLRATRKRHGASAVQSQQVPGYPDRLVFCLSEKTT